MGKLLLVGDLTPQRGFDARRRAFEELGWETIGFDMRLELPPVNRVLHWIRFRALVGPAIARVNRRILEVARRERPVLAWFDKATYVRPETVRELEALGTRTVSMMPDNPWGPRRDPGLRLYRASLPHYSAHVFFNPHAAASARAEGVRVAVLMRHGYDPAQHFPAPASWSEAERTDPVVFVGSPYDDRARFLVELYRDHGVATRVRGARWERTVLKRQAPELRVDGPQIGAAYREAFWRAKICLGFFTHSNLDAYAQRWYEIAGCAGFLLAERTPEGLETFAEDREAVFFTGVEECAAKIARWLPDAEGRARIAAAGHARARASRYDYNSVQRTALDRVLTELGRRELLPKNPA